jgi:hypothetical protein
MIGLRLWETGMQESGELELEAVVVRVGAGDVLQAGLKKCYLQLL